MNLGLAAADEEQTHGEGHEQRQTGAYDHPRHARQGRRVQQQQRVMDPKRAAEAEEDDAGHSSEAERHQAIDVGRRNLRDEPGDESRADEQAKIDDQTDIAEVLRLQAADRNALGDRRCQSQEF